MAADKIAPNTWLREGRRIAATTPRACAKASKGITKKRRVTNKKPQSHVAPDPTRD